MNHNAQWGIVGMGVMGTSLSRNFARNQIKLALYNRRVEGLEEEIAQTKKQLYPELDQAEAFEQLNAFVSAIASPKKIFLMLPAGNPTTQLIDQLIPLLSEGDLIIDGGNSHYEETEKRAVRLQEKGILFLGIGVSGGEEGALKGPSLMVGGHKQAYERVKNDLSLIAAKNSAGHSCCAYFGTGGAGHFVKMVHNGIEYAEMQLLAEAYALGRFSATYEEIQLELEKWNLTESKSYLLGITSVLLNYFENNVPFVELIQDVANNKGTGAWATSAGTQIGYPNTLMASAIHARFNSSFKKEREHYGKAFETRIKPVKIALDQLKKCYDFSRWINHHQGFEMLSLAAKKYNWSLNLGEVASVWSEGCIIKSELMNFCMSLFEKETSLLLSAEFAQKLKHGKEGWKTTLQNALSNEISVPCMQAAWSYFAALKTEKSTANLIQAQRDFFGAHGFFRIDQDFDKLQHGPWSTN